MPFLFASARTELRAAEQEDNYSSPKRSRYESGPLLRPVFESCMKCEHSQGSEQALLTLLALLMFPRDCFSVSQYFLWIFMPENQAKSLHCIFQPSAQDITSGRVPLGKNLFIFEYGSPAASVSFRKWPGCKRLDFINGFVSEWTSHGGVDLLVNETEARFFSWICCWSNEKAGFPSLTFQMCPSVIKYNLSTKY